MSLADLLPASFRGIPFGVTRSGGQFGRRNTVHQYPGRDTPWVEDLGRGARRYRFSGFLLQGDQLYGGGPIELQVSLLIAAVETNGPGLLTHPSLGVLNVSVDSFSIDQDLSADNFAAFDVAFVEAGQQLLPSILLDTASAVGSAAVLAVAAVALDAASAITLANASVSGPQAMVASATTWPGQVEAAAKDATAILGLASTLSGNNGRFASGGNVGFDTTIYSSDATVQDLVADASSARSTVAQTGAAVVATAQTLGVTSAGADLAAAVQAQIAALVSACADPADAIRLLLGLAAFAPATSGLPQAYSAVGDLYRRTALCALATTAASYQPFSYDDAQATLANITSALDDELDIAGDEGDDETFQGLRVLRQAVAQDLTSRGASLAPVRTFTTAAPLPDVVLAQQLYRDPTRATQLTTEIDEVHPLFCPTTFLALAA